MGDHQEELAWEVGPLEDGIDGYLPVGWLIKHNPDIDWEKGTIKWRSAYCKKHCLPVNLKRLTKQFAQMVEEGKAYQTEEDRQARIAAVWHDESGGDMAEQLPEIYREWADVFSQEKITTLPEHSDFDHEIKLTDGAKLPKGAIYPLAEKELEELRKYLKQMEDSGKIRRSQSPSASPFLFVGKPDGSYRPIVDYRALNAATVKDATPLPLMDEMRERLNTAKIFTKIDLKNGYNLVRIAKGHEWKTAFRTRYGLYEYLVMPQGLCNAPATFQRMMDTVFAGMVDNGVIIYLDDILIYSDTEEEHVELVKEVLRRLRKYNLCAAIKKSQFHTSEVEYLGFIISADGISMSERKIEAIRNWPEPKTVKNIQEFLGFANFYRRFIEGFSKIAHPLTAQTKKGLTFDWTPQCQKAFDTLKQRFIEAPILKHFRSSLPTEVETDASDFALGAIMSQQQPTTVLHPIAFHSRKFKSAELNYDIHDKEMLAIVEAFKLWEHMLKSVQGTITVWTDHKNLEYFTSTKVLSRRQARWAEHLAEFDFVIIYRPGTKNVKADVLSRRWDHAPEGGGEKPPESFLKPGQFRLSAVQLTAIPTIRLADQLEKALQAAASQDQEYRKTSEAVRQNDKSVDPEFEWKDELLLYQNRWVVPASTELRLRILRECHDSKVAGHFGTYKTLEGIKSNFYWAKMDTDVRDYVRSCDICQRDKASRHAKYGLLQSLEIPHRPWQDISMDFITGLPVSDGFDKIWVIVDLLTKMAHFIPLKSGEVSPGPILAQAFAKEIWRLHGLPSSIISDRDTQFTSKFWGSLTELLGIRLRMSTAFHPQTDGQTERVNQTLEEYLRHYTNYQQDDWVSLLPMAEHAYNAAKSESTKLSPFYANFGFEPATQWVRPSVRKEGNPAAEWQVKRFTGIWDYLQEEIHAAKQRQKTWANTKRLEQPPLRNGDKVMLDAKHLKTARPSKKLDHRKQGPFKILKRIGNRAFKLELPPTFKERHNVFPVSMLEPYRTSTIPGRHQSPPPPEMVQGEEEYEVEDIVDSKKRRGIIHYLVKWKGYPPEEMTWETYDTLEGALESVLRFHRRYKSKPYDPRVHQDRMDVDE